MKAVQLNKFCLIIFSAVLVALTFTTCTTAEKKKVHAVVKLFNNVKRVARSSEGELERYVMASTIEQSLDHFDERETRTWHMQYMKNGVFFKSGGPMFIFVGGETPITSSLIDEGRLIYDLAEEHNGVLFLTEHRFYSRSRPVANMTVENMKYLSVPQALADLAYFIRTMKSTIPGLKDSKAILVGCSYTGALITWFKKLYPDLAAGLWASSAPLLAKADFFEFKELLGEAIRQVGGENCFNRIKNGIENYEAMFSNKRGAKVKEMLKLCDSFDVNNEKDVATLFYEISEIFAAVVQTHMSYEIQHVCNQIMDGDNDANGLADYIKRKLSGYKNGCYDLSYNSYLKVHSDTSFNRNIMRQWIYQGCNELGWFQTSSSKNQPFGNKYDFPFFANLCSDLFGSNFTSEYITKKVEESNKMFGGSSPGVTNAHFTYGSLDPWRALGMQNKSQVTILPSVSHCPDLNTISFDDSPEMVNFKTLLPGLVRDWLRDWYE